MIVKRLWQRTEKLLEGWPTDALRIALIAAAALILLIALTVQSPVILAIVLAYIIFP